MVTVSLTASIDTILKSLPGQSRWRAPRYKEFILHERAALRRLANWPKRDFAHWIIAVDGEDITADLLYWPNLSLFVLAVGLMEKRAQEGEATGPLEMMYPGSILTAIEMEKLCNEVMRDESLLVNVNSLL